MSRDLYAKITLDERGLVGDDSTVTIGDSTVPLLRQGPTGVRVAPVRILATIDAMGYKTIDYYGSVVADKAARICTVPVVAKAARR